MAAGGQVEFGFLFDYFGFLGEEGEKAGEIGNVKKFRIDEFCKMIGLMKTLWNVKNSGSRNRGETVKELIEILECKLGSV